MMQFGSVVKQLNDALAANPDWKWYPVHVSALMPYTEGLKKVAIYLATHTHADGSAIPPDADEELLADVIALETPIVVIEVG